ncbi:cellulose biosynthesis protein BcsN [Kaistia dalseonensis]|uniref:Cellulose biosynthesis protein BcsN n=1 Tax=Kaistia dalseonensis TaxID=410840 RepID=A0ABU0HB44_9HYPH|nr:cellulose biosynthesis protein BcsN [Kaistia dalseonensis]MCX5496910.1 cellulose biosynthesis protein BcsN [Kaistia dalseonensis]MDQ0439535.1 hypothetical protein [Kaistia dalseonensis]
MISPRHDDRRQPRREGARRLSRLSLLACMAASIALAGCAGRRSDIQTGSIAARVEPDRAMVDMPPGGPAVIGVVERRYTNSTAQEIVLANRSHTAGQNVLTITMFGPVLQTTGPYKEMPNQPLAALNIGQEMKWALWGIPMSVSPYYAQNKYGSFGFATGHTKTGDTCLFAWQRIRAPDLDPTLISHQGTISIRLRLCETGATESALLDVMNGFTINSYFLTPGWNPFGEAPPPPPNVGVTGASVIPPPSVVSTAVPKAPVVRRVAPVAAAETLDDPLVLGPDIVPSPTLTPSTGVVPYPDAVPRQYGDYASVPPPS